MNCQTCGSPMRDLFTGQFCPNDCDKKIQAKEEKKVTTLELLLKKVPPSMHTGVCANLSSGFEFDIGLEHGRKTVHMGVVPINTKAWGLGKDTVLRCDWVIRYKLGGRVRVIKNRAARFDSLHDIPDYG